MKPMTKLKGAALLSMLALATASVTAQSPAEFTWEANATGVTVTGRAGSGETLVIPPQIQGRPVTAIGTAAFLQSGLSVVVLPASVTSIGAMAFASNQLTAITIPAGVTSIGSMAFANNSLTSVAIPPGVANIGYRAFHGNQLSVVIVPDGIASIGDEAFGGATLLRPDGTPVLLAELQQTASVAVPAAHEPRAVIVSKNWLSAEATVDNIFAFGMGGGIRYTRDINHFFSVGAIAFFYVSRQPAREIVPFSGGIMATALFFPGRRYIFYLELGMGWSRLLGSFGEVGGGPDDGILAVKYDTGFTMAPGIGWRLGGRGGGFFVNPFISIPTVFGEAQVRRAAPDPFGDDEVIFGRGGFLRLGVGLGLGWAW